ncbi:MAG: ABC transporter ATP-binding protein/permease [Lachnospiraceae bacterium]|nr:ABC transporter ATP-binding protein/permease [Lachnospiraceae bacterium]
MKKTFSNITYFLKIYLKYGKKWFWVVVLSCLMPPFRAYIDIVLLRDVMDAIGRGERFGEVVTRIILFLSVYLLTSLLEQAIEVYFGETVNVKIANRVNQDIYEKVLKTDYKYFDDPEFYDNYTWTLGRFYQQTFSAVQLIWRFLFVAGTIMAVSAVMAAMDVVTILFVLVTVLFCAIFNWRTNKKIYQKSCAIQPFQRRLNYIQNVFYRKEHSLGLKATNIGNVFMEQYGQSSGEMVGVLKKYRGKIALFGSGSILTTVVMKMGILVYLVYCVLEKEMSLGTFTALFYASETLKNNMENFLQFVNQMQNLDLYTEKIRKFFGMTSVIEEDKFQGKEVGDKPFWIEFDNVSFHYGNQEAEVLRGVSFQIKAGSRVALVGENGGGKTTISKLLLRLYDVDKGEIRINGIPIADCRLAQLREKIAVAFQDSMIYAMSLRDNIRIYDSKVGDDRIGWLMEQIGIEKMLSKNNGCLDSELTREFSREGLELSGGESQMVAVARVFIKEFGLLILDEPSASLDPLREYQLNQFLLKETQGRTVLFISHRLSAVKDADCILFLEDGRIVEKGTHEVLMQKKGRYYEMFTKQAEGYIEKSST